MAEKSEEKKKTSPDDRFRYIGFEVFSGKVGDLFKSDKEKDQWVEKVKAKREKGGILRERCTLTEERVAGYEKIVMTVTSLLLIATLFLPWFSGYTETAIQAEVPAVEENIGIMPEEMGEVPVEGEVEGIPPGEVEGTADTESEQESGLVEAMEDEVPPVETEVVGEADEAGFTSITATRKRIEIEREHLSMSAFGAIASMGDIGGKVFSSGPVVVITGILILLYMLLCIFMAIYTLYILYGSKGDADQKALQIKKAVRYNWVGLGIWGVMLLISFFGASYSFDTSEMIVQLGGSYGPGTFLGLLSFGFYISLACFIMNAVKGSEI